MLSELRIQNFAIIDQIELTLAANFNVITGETGAGKSIIIDAVDMLLGGRADVAFVRAGAEKAVIEGVFKLSKEMIDELHPLLEAESVEPAEAPDEVLLTRELRSNGRSACRVNGTVVSLQFFRDVGDRLVDIHGQSEHLSLLKSKGHVNLLDRYADLMAPRRELAGIVRQVQDVRGQIENLMQDEAALARRIDMLKFQIDEIHATDPQLGEEEDLKEERTRLSNAEQLASLTRDVQRALADTDDSDQSAAMDLLSQAAALLTKLARIDPTFEEARSLAESLSEQADDLARTVRAYRDRIEYNPSRLNEVEERVDALTRLKRKYGGSIQAVLDYSAKAQRDLDTITHSEEHLAELRVREDQLLHQIGAAAAKLSAARRAAAQTLGHQIESEMQELRMGGARFEVALSHTDDPNGCFVNERRLAFDVTGVDQVEFLMSANPGEPLRPMAKVASGGETARIMLSLKGVLSRADQTPTLIFDEIDQGIGGRVGLTVGRKLWSLAETHQVICVTHLAQLAGFGDSHFKVAKQQKGDRTLTSIKPLNDPERVDEIAEMLGSESQSAKQSAQDILTLAREIKSGGTPKPIPDGIA
jgi:DNA repair protein RecN (Recombination protein N)